MFNWLLGRWEVFRYNFRWSDYEGLLNGRLATAAAITPVLGYAVLFNDYIWEEVDFTVLAEPENTTWIIDPRHRVRFVYFGLVFLGLSNLLYRWRRPQVLRQARNQFEFIDFSKSHLTLIDIFEMHSRVARDGHSTPQGKDHLKEWNQFWEVAREKTEMINSGGEVEGATNFQVAMNRFEGMIRNLAVEHFFFFDTRRRLELCIAIALALTGLFLLAVPSLDLFLRVVSLTFF